MQAPTGMYRQQPKALILYKEDKILTAMEDQYVYDSSHLYPRKVSHHEKSTLSMKKWSLFARCAAFCAGDFWAQSSVPEMSCCLNIRAHGK